MYIFEIDLNILYQRKLVANLGTKYFMVIQNLMIKLCVGLEECKATCQQILPCCPVEGVCVSYVGRFVD